MTQPDSFTLPLNESESPRMFALGRWAARAMICELAGITPYTDAKQPNPLLRVGYTFIFKVFTRKVEIRIPIRDLAGRKEHELVTTMTEVLKNDRIQSLSGN